MVFADRWEGPVLRLRQLPVSIIVYGRLESEVYVWEQPFVVGWAHYLQP
jgi:hypothetical protein